MRELANRLQHMGCINRDIRLAISLASPYCDRLLSLRADFSFECGQLLNQLTGKLYTHEHARAASRLLDAYVAMHRLMNAHQQRWSSAEIGRDPDGYIASSQGMNAAIINFLEVAMGIVDDAAAPLRFESSSASAFAPAPTVRLTGTR